MRKAKKERRLTRGVLWWEGAHSAEGRILATINIHQKKEKKGNWGPRMVGNKRREGMEGGVGEKIHQRTKKMTRQHRGNGRRPIGGGRTASE